MGVFNFLLNDIIIYMGRESGVVTLKSGKTLTLKQAKFVKAIVDGKNGSQATIVAGYHAKNARNRTTQAHANISKPYIQEAIQEELNARGFSISGAVDRLGVSIDRGLGVKATNKDSLRGLEMVFKLHGLLDTKKTVENKTLRLSLKVKDMAELKEALKSRSDKLDNDIDKEQ